MLEGRREREREEGRGTHLEENVERVLGPGLGSERVLGPGSGLGPGLGPGLGSF